MRSARPLSATLTALTVLVVGCQTPVIDGAPTTPAGAGRGTPVTSAGALPPGGFAGYLLDRQQMVDVLGDTEMVKVEDYTERASGVDQFVTPDFGCPSRFVLSASSAWDSFHKEISAMIGTGYETPRHFAAQIVALYDTEDNARSAMSAAASEFRTRCPEGQQVTLQTDTGEQVWAAGVTEPKVDTWTLPGDIPRLTTVSRRVQPPGPRVGSVAFGRRGHYLVGALVRADEESATALANTVVDRIQAKLPG